MISCVQCGREFEPRTRNQKYCDKDCTRIATNLKLMAAYYHKKKRLEGVPRSCLSCGQALSRYNPKDICYICDRQQQRRDLSLRISIEITEATKKYGK